MTEKNLGKQFICIDYLDGLCDIDFCGHAIPHRFYQSCGLVGCVRSLTSCKEIKGNLGKVKAQLLAVRLNRLT